MNIVVALDKFKGSLTAPRACEIVQKAMLSSRPELQIVIKPMADGGDGTADVLCSALGGDWVFQRVTGPLEAMPLTGKYLWIAKRNWAAIEMATTSGLALLRPEQRDPLRTTTHGTGELVRAATERGAVRILLGVGGSATVDGGVGAALALGWRFLDANGKPVGHGGGELERIARIETPPECHSERSEESQLLGRGAATTETLRVAQGDNLQIEVLCDVENPLCGESGAARVFGPQKGATPEMVERLDAGLRHLAELVKTQLGKDVADVPGAGAAGGLAFGAMAFMNARLVSGVDAVAEAIELDDALRGADWVITGEGCFDEQSLRGKVVSGVVKRARKFGVKVAVLAGSVKTAKPEGVEILLATRKQGMSLDHAMANASPLLKKAAVELAGLL